MVGIKRYGVYIPFNRLSRKNIGEAYGKKSPAGERSVANYDEDSITMAVAAGLGCLKDYDTNKIGAAYFASTTAPYLEKQCATTLSGALDLSTELRAADFAGTLRAGSEAFLTAADAAMSGRETLVAVADCRMGAADGANEMNFGDAAAAFLIGNDDLIATIDYTYSLSSDFHDMWRDKDDKFVRTWEDRFPFEEFYSGIVKDAALAVMKKAGLKPSDFSKVVLYAHTERYQLSTAKALGFTPEQVQNGNYASIGNAGAACAPLMLAGALDSAKPGDRILYLGYGEGCDAIIFTVTEEISKIDSRPILERWISRKKNTMNYTKYLRWKNQLNCEPARRPKPMRTSLPEYYRIHEKNLGLYGSVCKCCGTPQYPPTRICVECGAKDGLELYRFYGHRAFIKTFTIDYLADSQDPPNAAVCVDFEGGGRLFTYLVDCEPGDVSVGTEVEMSFRCLQVVDGIHTYFWKAVLKQEEAEE